MNATLMSARSRFSGAAFFVQVPDELQQASPDPPEFARDILSRLIHGSRVSLLVGLSVVAIGGTFGVTLGILAGYLGGWTERIIMRLVDIQLGFPFILLALTIVAVLGPSMRNLILALALSGWVGYARVVRAEVLSLRGGIAAWQQASLPLEKS